MYSLEKLLQHCKQSPCFLPSGRSMGYSKLCVAQSSGQHSSARGERWLCWNTQSHAESCGLLEQGNVWKNNMRYGGRVYPHIMNICFVPIAEAYQERDESISPQKELQKKTNLYHLQKVRPVLTSLTSSLTECFFRCICPWLGLSWLELWVKVVYK